MAASVGILGVPTSAGSHNAGQENAPAAWRAAALIDRLEAAGIDVVDYGDLDPEPYRPTEPVGGVRDLERVAGVAARTADAVARITGDGRMPFVLGGDCTITLGVLAGLQRSAEVGLLYLDGDADLSLPETTDSGVLDTMGMSHLLGDGLQELAGLGPNPVLLQPDQLVLFGFDPAELDTGQWTRLVTRQLYAVPAPAVRTDPAAAADRAWTWLASRVPAILLHFDVDVLHTGRHPLANFPHFDGLTIDEVAAGLDRFLSDPACVGLVVTEVNPDHDPGGTTLGRLVSVLAGAF